MMPSEALSPDRSVDPHPAASGEPAAPAARAEALQSLLAATLSHSDRLLARFREVEAAFAALAGRLDVAPRPEEVAALVMRLESARHETDWLAGKADYQVAARLAALQARLDMLRAELTSLQEEAAKTADLAREVARARQELEGLSIPAEAIERARTRSESLLALVAHLLPR